MHINDKIKKTITNKSGRNMGKTDVDNKKLKRTSIILGVVAFFLIAGGICLIVLSTKRSDWAPLPEMLIPGILLTFFGAVAGFSALAFGIASAANNTMQDIQGEVADGFNSFEDMSKNFIKKAKQFQRELADDSITCEYCGSKNDGDAHECKNCGSALK